MSANLLREFPPFAYNNGYLPDKLFPYLGEATYERANNLCPHCLVASRTVGHLWIQYGGTESRYPNGDVWMRGKRYVFCPNCHWVFNIRAESRQWNWRSMPTAEEARKRLGREAQ